MSNKPSFDTKETFLRVQSVYDLDRLATCRVIYVGTGGAASFIEDMVRTGIGEHILIDPDMVSETNLATQQTYVNDIGKSKVACIKKRIENINPQAKVDTYSNLLDEIDDKKFSELVDFPFGFPHHDGVKKSPHRVTLLCGFTDNFAAQARVNRLALQFGIPSLCAQLYQEGQGAEITFTYPGITPACHRCVLSSRYKAYLEEGFQNTVTSDGTPIFATTRVNALKGFIAMAILHHGTNHPRWGGLLTRIGNRNLIQIRMDPDLHLSVFHRVLGNGDTTRILFDEALWLPQEQDSPETGYPACPDCGGTGDLRTAEGTFADTRNMERKRTV